MENIFICKCIKKVYTNKNKIKRRILIMKEVGFYLKMKKGY